MDGTSYLPILPHFCKNTVGVSGDVLQHTKNDLWTEMPKAFVYLSGRSLGTDFPLHKTYGLRLTGANLIYFLFCTAGLHLHRSSPQEPRRFGSSSFFDRSVYLVVVVAFSVPVAPASYLQTFKLRKCRSAPWKSIMSDFFESWPILIEIDSLLFSFLPKKTFQTVSPKYASFQMTYTNAGLCTLNRAISCKAYPMNVMYRVEYVRSSQSPMGGTCASIVPLWIDSSCSAPALRCLLFLGAFQGKLLTLWSFLLIPLLQFHFLTNA